MLYLYLLTIPAIVGGMAAFLKLKRTWMRVGGLALMAVGLLALFLMPATWRQSA